MNKTLLFLILSAGLPQALAEPPRPPRPRVAVLKFENLTRSQERIKVDHPAYQQMPVPWVGKDQTGALKFPSESSVERYGEMARSLLERTLTAWAEIEVIERSHVDLLEQEVALNRSRGGRRVRDELPLKQHGVDFLVIGQLLDMWSESSAFQGYGIRNQTDSTSAQIYLRVVKIGSEGQVFSETKIGTFDLVATLWGRSTHSDLPAAAIRETVGQFTADPLFRRTFLQKVQESATPILGISDGVEVVFKTKPKGAIVEIDGHYVGATPLTRNLPPGLALAVSLSHATGIWAGRIIPEQGLVVAPMLLPRESNSTPNSKSVQP